MILFIEIPKKCFLLTKAGTIILPMFWKTLTCWTIMLSVFNKRSWSIHVWLQSYSLRAGPFIHKKCVHRYYNLDHEAHSIHVQKQQNGLYLELGTDYPWCATKHTFAVFYAVVNQCMSEKNWFLKNDRERTNKEEGFLRISACLVVQILAPLARKVVERYYRR